MEALWKQDQPLHPTFAAMNNCLSDDWFLLPFELKLQRAHARTLAAAGIFSADECAEILGGLERIEQEHSGGTCPDSDAEDLHTWIEGKLTELAGEAGKKIHTARSRNDQVATLLKMYLIDAGGELSRQLGSLIEICCRRAKDWSELVFPLQTHCQFAAPGSVGFWAMRYAMAFDRVRTHLDSCMSQWRRYCPLGAGAVAGSSIPIDRTLQAAELGFDQPAANALDATTSRDECLDMMSLAVQVGLHLQSLAVDVVAFGQTPFRWTRYPRAFGTGSSMMPNKTNPDAMELLRGRCNSVIAAHHEAVLLLKGLPSGYNRDLQCIKPLVRKAVDELRSLCGMTTAFLAELDFDPERLSDSLQLGDIGATLRMEEKVVGGLPLREAHHATAVESQSAEGRSAQLGSDSADAYQTLGSASPKETRRLADQLLATLKP